MNRLNNYKESFNLLFYLSILTLLFCFIQISYLFNQSGFYLGDIQSISKNLAIPGQVYVSMSYFILIQISIHIIFILILWAEMLLIGKSFNLSWSKINNLAFYLWIICVLAAIVGNQYYFPNSKFAALTAWFISQAFAGAFYYICFSIITVVTTLAIIGFFECFPKLSFSFILLGLTSYAILYFIPEQSIEVTDGSNSKKPNIIIIGIDSLRPDHLSYFGSEVETPYIDNFLDDSTVFTEALTPIARTFPSWVSILTGQYPKQSGARTNLEDITHIKDLENTLPNILRRSGYNTIFATDETRFSNIDHQYGFDHLITPPIGLNDFLIGTINDFPFSNALVNTSIGQWLFPNSFASRPIASTYDPNSFLSLINAALKKPREQPLFLAIHFCLPHTPYFWGTQVSTDKPYINYQASLQRVDKQFSDFMSILKKNKVLDHAIVVLLSDHGEALELKGDRVTDPSLFIVEPQNKNNPIPHFYPSTLKDEFIDRSVGHGTDVLSMTQHHTLLAFQMHGLPQTHIKDNYSEHVSLLDIKPTLLRLININTNILSGKSLHDVITGIVTSMPLNDFFIETDFSPESIRTVHPETRDVVFDGINYFRIDPITARLIVKSSMEDLIISSKQYADVYGDWILALYPQSNFEMMPVLVNLRTGEWTNDLQSTFAMQSPATHMLQALQNFYGNEITKIMNIA